MSSSSAEKRIQRLERRINGLKHSLSELREENEELRDEIDALREFESQTSNQLTDLHERLADHRDQFRQIKVNQHRIKDLYLRLQGKIGINAFEIMEERVKQLRSQIDYMTEIEDDEMRLVEQEA